MSDKEEMVCITERRYRHLLLIEDEFRRITSELQRAVEDHVDKELQIIGRSWLEVLIRQIKQLRERKP